MKKYLLLLVCVMYLSSVHSQDSVSILQIQTAEKLAGLHFTTVKRDSMASVLTGRIKTYNYLHNQNFSNDMPLPLWFNPVLPGMDVPRKQLPVHFSIPEQVPLPADRNQLAF